MADVDVQGVAEGGLEQRERKPKQPKAEANGHAEVPDFEAADDFIDDGVAEEEPVAPAANGDVAEALAAEEPEEGPSNKLYFVRIPRPPINDDEVKKLSANFQDQVAKVKVMNGKLATKREELRELRRQMGVARSLKDGSQPEYEEKLNRLKGLQASRDTYVQKMKAIKETLRGLECKSEEELDAKIKELEGKISHGMLALREEKNVVGQISKLQSQRTQVRDYDNQKGSMAELEAEANKIRTVISELEGEFTILKAERDQAQGIIKEIFTKVKACEAEVKELEEEQADVVKAKNDHLAALDKARTEMNDSMGDYRDNRSFSLRVRDLVTAGQVEEARTLCQEQTATFVDKIKSDAEYRKEYYKLWASQRRYAVSELLPDSSTVAKEGRDNGRPDPRGAAGAKGKAAAKAAPPKPQGAEKAKLLIEQLMAEAQAEVSRKPRQVADEPPSDDDEIDVPVLGAAVIAGIGAGIAASQVEVTAKPAKAAPSARPADVLKQVELPQVEDVPFVPPVLYAAPVAMAVTEDKEKVREEQIRKAQEAEARKKKAAEQKEKKRKESEIKRKQDEEVKKQDAVIASQQKAEAKRREEEEKAARARAAAELEAQRAATTSASNAALPPAQKIIARSQQTSSAKRPKANEDLLKKVKKFAEQHQIALAVAAVGLLMAIILAMLS